MIIGLVGRAGAGKDSAFSAIKNVYGDFENKKFASGVKKVAELLTGIPKEKFEDQDFKLQMDHNWGMTYREMLQKIGTDAIRDGLHKDSWVKMLMKDYSGQNWVITDVRFPNEAMAIKESGGVMIRIDRWFPGDFVRVGITEQHQKDILVTSHKSITRIQRFPSFFDSDGREHLAPGLHPDRYHESETKLFTIPCDYYVLNMGLEKDFRQAIIAIVNNLI